ncbi:MAG: nucleotide sugar dehydrogenase [Paracoccaceae bacterium]
MPFDAQGGERIAVIGLGYVGYPVSVALAGAFDGVIGFDTDTDRVRSLRDGRDLTNELTDAQVAASSVRVTADACDLSGANFFVVTVPTPINKGLRPDLFPLKSACRTIAGHLKPGSVVVFESTVYPGATEELCGPLLESLSGLKAGRDFKLAYSPERINPGDPEHPLERVVKVVSGQDAETLERVAAVYGRIVRAGIHRAPSIRVAEAAKVIENTQRDVNIALMNELAMICDRIGIRTTDVIEAAASKWNFLEFSPGLVGGHCIGVDPYYLTAKAEELGYHPQVILSGRRVNDGMGRFVAQKAIRFLSTMKCGMATARVGLLGLTFKENVPDLRNSRAFDIIEELQGYGVSPMVHDPLADPATVHRTGNRLRWTPLKDMRRLDLMILAVPHRAYRDMPAAALCGRVRESGTVMDLRGALAPGDVGARRYWSL